MQSITCCCFSGKWAYAQAALTATITLLALGLIGYYAKTDSASFQEAFLGTFGGAAGVSFLLFIQQLIKNCGAEVTEAPLTVEQRLVKENFDRLKQRLESVDSELRSRNTEGMKLERRGQNPKSPEYTQTLNAVSTLREEVESLRGDFRTLIAREDFNRVAFSEHPPEQRAQARADFNALFAKNGAVVGDNRQRPRRLHATEAVQSL